MEFPTRRPSTGAPLEHLSAHARLALTPDRAEVVAPVLDSIVGLIDQLDAIDIGETPVATAFDARWE